MKNLPFTVPNHLQFHLRASHFSRHLKQHLYGSAYFELESTVENFKRIEL